MSISLSETLIAFLTKDAFSSGSEMTASRTIPTTERTTTKMSDVESTLIERGSRYGSFRTHAIYAEAFNGIFSGSPNWHEMKPDAKESLRIIANKIGRILNGDPEYDDNWRDIAGYATLVLQRIEDEQKFKSAEIQKPEPNSKKPWQHFIPTEDRSIPTNSALQGTR